jgi:aldose 1-epimerase
MCKGRPYRIFVREPDKSPEVRVAASNHQATIELATGDAVAVVDLARGGRLGSLRVRGRELLVTAPDATDRTIHWGSFLMAPWVGRLADGRLRWRGESIQLPRNHGRHAIHGTVFDRAWQLDGMGPAGDARACELSVVLDRHRWPFGGIVRQRLALHPGRLELSAEISATEPMPAAVGWHPWFRRTIGRDDASIVRLRLRGAGMLERRAMIPTGRILPASGPADLTTGPELGRRRLDDAFVGLTQPPVLAWPELRLTLEIASPLTVVTVYTPWNAVCVEPQTAWPNALALDDGDAERAGAALVEPGRPLRVGWSLRWD